MVRPRRTRGARALTKVALSRSIEAVLITVPLPVALSTLAMAGAVPRTTRRRAYRLMTWPMSQPGATTNRGRPRRPGTHRIPEDAPEGPHLGSQPVHTDKQSWAWGTGANPLNQPADQRTVAMGADHPAQPRRDGTAKTIVIPMRWPTLLTLSSSACTWPRSPWPGWTRCRWTWWQCSPARACH
jgi:hypothetical protein